MPVDKDFKRLIRQRMSLTGERYTAARRALVAQAATPGEPTSSPPTARNGERWMELLGDARQNQGAFDLLKALPPEELRPLAIAGTHHDNPRVRRRSCQLLDDLSLTPDSISALEQCAGDPDPRVRAAAFHTMSCHHCKPDGVCLDQRTVAERAAFDRSATVRRGVALGLSWNPEHSDEWAVTMASRLLDDPSAEIRRHARAALDRIERQRRTDSLRRQLPEDLQRKTERHPGKWVAIVDGSVVAVNPPPSWRRRRPSAQLYFVVPGEEAATPT